MKRVIEVSKPEYICPFQYSATMPTGDAREICGYKRENLHEFNDIICCEEDCPLFDSAITVQLRKAVKK